MAIGVKVRTVTDGMDMPVMAYFGSEHTVGLPGTPERRSRGPASQGLLLTCC